MLASMTGFTRHQVQNHWGHAVWEIRSVNHRYLELNIRLPDMLAGLEGALRDVAKQTLQRGKVDCTLKLQTHTGNHTHIHLDISYAKQLVQAHQQLTELHDEHTALDVMALLRWPGVIIEAQIDVSKLQADLLESFNHALQDLIATRQREGLAIKYLIEQRLAQMAQLVQQLQNKLPQLIELQRNKLRERFANAQLDLDPARLEQEMVLYIQKTDIAEELDRLTTHLSELQRLLDQGGAQGRRLDFLLQELNREANTLGSKANSLEVTNTAVELKVLLEQVREQIQNLE